MKRTTKIKLEDIEISALNILSDIKCSEVNNYIMCDECPLHITGHCMKQQAIDTLSKIRGSEYVV